MEMEPGITSSSSRFAYGLPSDSVELIFPAIISRKRTMCMLDKRRVTIDGELGSQGSWSSYVLCCKVDHREDFDLDTIPSR